MQSGAIWTLKFGKHRDFIVVNEVRKLMTFSSLAKKTIIKLEYFRRKLSIVSLF